MPQDELSGPDLDGVVADAEAIGRFLDRIGATRLHDGKTLSADDVAGTPTPFASLRTLAGFKRLADRGQDRLDLENLERVNGELPIDPIPGFDT
jgi:hypothetical protein